VRGAACTCGFSSHTATHTLTNVERRTGNSQAETRTAVGARSVRFDWIAYQNGGTDRPTLADFESFDNDPGKTYSVGGDGNTLRFNCPFCGATGERGYTKPLLYFTNSNHWQCIVCGERRRAFQGADDNVTTALQRLLTYVNRNRNRMHDGERKVLRALVASLREQRTITDAAASSHALAHATGVPQRKVWTILQKLVRCGVLSKTKDGKQGSGIDCSARFTLRVDGLVAPYTDPMAARYEKRAFNHVQTSPQEGHSEDTYKILEPVDEDSDKWSDIVQDAPEPSLSVRRWVEPHDDSGNTWRSGASRCGCPVPHDHGDGFIYAGFDEQEALPVDKDGAHSGQWL
jgi:hypothetical protein